MTSAILSLCPDLTDPNAINIPLFRVSIEDGQRISLCYLQTYEEMRRFVGLNNLLLEIVQLYPWSLTAFLHEVGADHFFERLARDIQHSSIFVERIEPC